MLARRPTALAPPSSALMSTSIEATDNTAADDVAEVADTPSPLDPTPPGDVPILSDQEAQLCAKLLLPIGPEGVLVELGSVDSPPFDPTALPSLPRVDRNSSPLLPMKNGPVVVLAGSEIGSIAHGSARKRPGRGLLQAHQWLLS